MQHVARRVSLADVAAAAGVGKATASRALSDGPSHDIGAETRARVRTVADQLGYVPNRTAQALARGRTHAVALVVPIEEWAWWAPVVQGAAVESARAELQLLVHPVNETSRLEDVLVDLRARGLDGAVVMTNARLESSGAPSSIPIVLIDDIDAAPSLPTVRSDNRRGGYELGQLLLEGGRTAPAVLLPNPEAHFAVERLAGFRQAFHEAGYDVPAERVVVVTESYDLTPQLRQDVQEAIKSFRGSIDSIFAIADYVAASVLQTLSELSIAVPKDIAVVGYDDERAASLLTPPLTTLHQPLHEMGEEAIRTLAAVIEGKEIPLLVQELPGELVVRLST